MSSALTATSLNLSQLSVTDAQGRGECARSAVLTVFPSLVSPHFPLYHVALFRTSPARHGQQQLQNFVRVCGKNKSRLSEARVSITSPTTETVLLNGGKKGSSPRRGQAESARCEESTAVPSYLQATGKLWLWLSGGPLPSLLFVCVWVSWLFCMERKQKKTV